MKNMFNEIGTFTDNLNGRQYKLCLANAKELGSYLKANLKGNGVDYSKFNSESDDEGLVKNPPKEIYEYQNFFLLDMSGNATDHVLLDGFRRLLWYDAPDTSVLVRVYKKDDLTNEEVLSLMVRLNHFKFYSDSDYFDRGFALFMRMIFDLNILDYKQAFDSYLSCNEKDEDDIRNSYTGGMFRKEGNEKTLSVKERILRPQFISDMSFLQELHEKGAMINSFVGAMTYMFRKKTDIAFNADEFLRIANANPVMPKLMEKFRKVGTNSSAESHKAVNPILEIYGNVFKQLLGGKAVKSHSELMVECKEISESIKKEKGWTKMTGSQNIHDIEEVLLDKLRNKKEVEYKMVVYPFSDKHKDFYGLVEPKYKIKYEQERSYPYAKELKFDANIGGENFSICHNHLGSYGGRHTKKYVYIEREWKLKEEGDAPRMYDIDFFVNISKEEIEVQLRKRFPERYKVKEKPAFEIPEQKDEKLNITTKNIREFIAGKDTIYLCKSDRGFSYHYLCRFKKFEKGIVTGEIISKPERGHHDRSGEVISALLTKCYLKGKLKKTDYNDRSCWFDKDGTIS